VVVVVVAKEALSRAMAPLMSSPPLEPLILYATETGNAQDVADNIARNLRRVSANSRVKDMATYSPASLPHFSQYDTRTLVLTGPRCCSSLP